MKVDLNSSQLYFNRELSWLQFNSRVLAQALDEKLPPLERLKFLAIYGTNLDVFYMIRVAGLKALIKARVQETGPDKLTPSEQLEQIQAYLHKEHQVLESCYTSIIAELHNHGVNVKHYDALNTKEQVEIKEK
ncbi:MAG TPA: hypothetical protein VLL31_04545, partial [Sulfurovum sp.]|nr:hypothetical protein [Sulfurovum sp.]